MKRIIASTVLAAGLVGMPVLSQAQPHKTEWVPCNYVPQQYECIVHGPTMNGGEGPSYKVTFEDDKTIISDRKAKRLLKASGYFFHPEWGYWIYTG